jgi:hypothetical protein
MQAAAEEIDVKLQSQMLPAQITPGSMGAYTSNRTRCGPKFETISTLIEVNHGALMLHTSVLKNLKSLKAPDLEIDLLLIFRQGLS